MTPAAVVSDPELGRKVTLVDSKLVPLYAILDPLLTLGLPGHITAATGMDALSHAVEGLSLIHIFRPLRSVITIRKASFLLWSVPMEESACLLIRIMNG